MATQLIAFKTYIAKRKPKLNPPPNPDEACVVAAGVDDGAFNFKPPPPPRADKMAVGAEVVVVLFPSKPLSREEEVVVEGPTAVVVAGAEPNPNPKKQKNNGKWWVSSENEGLSLSSLLR